MLVLITTRAYLQALYGAFSCISLALAYVADRLQPCHRAPAFGYVMASLCVGVLLGPLVGGALNPVPTHLAS